MIGMDAIRGSGPSTTTPLSRPSPLRRRRLSKGLIADGGSRSSTDKLVRPTESKSTTGIIVSTLPSSEKLGRDNDEIPSLPKACYFSRLAVVLVQNALKMSVVTKFLLCPQGKARKTLLTKAKEKRHQSRFLSSNEIEAKPDSYDRVIEEFLKNANLRADVDMELYSSGDDDDFDASYEDEEKTTKSPTFQSLDQKYKEPLFIPVGSDAASIGLQGNQVLGPGKLPFNYRKLRYFDAVTASDRSVARKFIKQEISNTKKIRMKALTDHLKTVQNKERERIKNEALGVEPVQRLDAIDSSQTVDLSLEQHALATALSRFPQELTPTMSAALIIEILAINHHESIEGMAKCYDGIFSAGAALLDLKNDVSRDSKPKLTTTEITSALAPLLITTLEQPSGEVLIALAKLRNYCGTKRYQRRFVQRIAPFLVRPSDGAIWCLRQQSEIEPIIAAVEMILDNAVEIFSSGWYERGRNLLKDTQRAEKLRSAASQLRRLNSRSPTEGPLLGLSSLGTFVNRRGSFTVATGVRKDGAAGNESLTEWEFLAIDKHIRQSILDIFSKDWGRINSSHLLLKEGDVTTFGSRHKRGISASKSKVPEWQHDSVSGISGSTSSSLMSSSLLLSKSPRSKIPLSPRGLAPFSGSPGMLSQIPSADVLESTFGPSFSSQIIDDDGFSDPQSPTNDSTLAPLSPTRDSALKLVTPKTPPPSYEYRSQYNAMSTEQNVSPVAYDLPRGGPLAPLSPQSSFENLSISTGGTMPQRSLISSNIAVREQYRALTSSAAERKRTVAACRALRAQITKFEEAFVQLHGRAPKAAAERAPLASTYMQYREWKRAIRADAACRIQALCRGACVRSMMSQSREPRTSGFLSLQSVIRTKIDHTSDTLSYLSIPIDIGSSGAVHSSIVEQVALLGHVDSRSTSEAVEIPRGDDGVEVVMRPTAPNPLASISSNSSNLKSKNQINPSSPAKPRNSLPDVTVMSLPELQQRKREMKQQLKMYDLNFHAQHGRMPEKREKEPIRHLYESYNAYKNQISVIEKGEAQPGPGTAAFRSEDISATSPGIEPSPDNGFLFSEDTGCKSPIQENAKTSPKNTAQFALNDVASSNINSVEEKLSLDLASLKAEKAALHQMLRTYEKEFFKQHKRQVSSFGDIRPVAGQYRRYKEIKKAIAYLQEK